MANLNYSQKIQDNIERLGIKSMESLLGRDLRQPFTNTNSGARKLMHAVHLTHVFSLMHPEKAIIETGYEIRFGDLSSSIIQADSTYQVIGKISKFSFAPNHHYWLIIKDTKNNKLDYVERISYQHVTESYGYLNNNEYMDNLVVGDYIRDGQIIQKSLAFDEYNNRTDGINMNVAYMALDDNMEDSIIFSDKAASKLASSLIKPVEIMINDNDIPLNLYGDDKVYKIIPDIGEEVKDANLIALRKEKKEESYFSQSITNLSKLTISDDNRQVHGRVIDIEIYCNNPDILESHYYGQLKMYYNELHRYSTEIVQLLTQYSSQGYEMTFELEKLFGQAKRVMNYHMYSDRKPFSNILLKINVLEEKKFEAGDKASNRYGGKGVCSDIWPVQYMPRYKNAKGEYEYVDIIFNSSTMINRENVGQTFELSLTHIGGAIIDKIISDRLPLDDAYNLIHKFVSLCNPEQAEYMEEKKKSMTRDELAFFVESYINFGNIDLSLKPISDSISIDKLNEIYKEFPWIEQNEIEVPLTGSNGQVRYVPARRRIVVGKQYIYRLKQFTEEKYSATSLSATNIRNENTKSRVKKDFKELYANTPVRFGNMEINDMSHLGVDVVVTNLMIHSVSPQGRRLVEQMYTGDPFNINIRLNNDAKNRSAEIANTYLKTTGRRLIFLKKKKERHKITRSPISFTRDPHRHPISFTPLEDREGFDYEKDFKERQEFLAKKSKMENIRSPFRFEGRQTRKDLYDEED